MYCYTIFGYTLSSYIKLDQLYPHDEIPAENCDIRITDSPIPSDIKNDINENYINPGYRTADSYVWFINVYGIFVITKAGDIYIENTSDEDPLTLMQYVLGYGIAIYAHMNNTLCIHGSGVVLDSKAIIITGTSTSGKSTITHELLKKNAKMLADDITAVRIVSNESCKLSAASWTKYESYSYKSCSSDTDSSNIRSYACDSNKARLQETKSHFTPNSKYCEGYNFPMVFPAFPQTKLCRDQVIKQGLNVSELTYIDQRKDKFALINKDAFTLTPHPLSYIFLLDKYNPDKAREEETAKDKQSCDVIVTEITGFQKIELITRNMFLSFMLKDMGLNADIFSLCTAIAKECPIYHIKRPVGKDTVSEITSIIENIVAVKNSK